MSYIKSLGNGRYLFAFDYVNGHKTTRVHYRSARNLNRKSKSHFRK